MPPSLVKPLSCLALKNSGEMSAYSLPSECQELKGAGLSEDQIAKLRTASSSVSVADHIDQSAQGATEEDAFAQALSDVQAAGHEQAAAPCRSQTYP